MNSKKMITFILTTILTIGAVLSVAAQTDRVQAPKPGTLQLTPDLEVTIEAFENANATGKINNGGTTVYSGGAPKNYVRFTIKNKGSVKAENFTYKMVVKCNGVKVFDPAATQLSLNAGESKTFPIVPVNLAGITNNVEADILANIMKLMKEDNMSNNKAEFKFTGKVVQ